MNKSALKSYAPQARKDFIAAVTQRAQWLGLDPTRPATVQTTGDVLLIDGRPHPISIKRQLTELSKRIQQGGFAHYVESVAYTWFNRLVALRYMELHSYLDHGYRVLSHPAGQGQPEILEHIQHLTLPGLNQAQAVELKLAGNRDEELYRRILLAQCHALHAAMPFLFEVLDDATELLLPDNLLRTDSVIAKLVCEIPEADWAEVEAIGWLYQFYISEKKDQVIGKVVKSEDIPAATQLFTPNWIVQYLVQNSVGRLWLMANPHSTLASQWAYYIQPAEQTPEVQAQLNALIHTRMEEDGGSLNPETITVLDPACGSGHILVVAYDVLKAIYLERGYQPRAIPRLILQNNLYGLDIDDRAAQLAGFAVLMKARADDRRLFDDPPQFNVLSLQESKGLDIAQLAPALAPFGIERTPLKLLVEAFEHAKTFGSLIQIAPALKAQLPAMTQGLQQALQSGDLFVQQAAMDLLPLAQQAVVLGKQFDSVVANPPYMGSKGMNPALKDYARTAFPDSKSDLFAIFMERGFSWCKPMGFSSMITMQSWMFLSSFEAMRVNLLQSRTISNMAHLGARAFSEISGEVVQTTAFSNMPLSISNYRPTFFRLIEGDEADKDLSLKSGRNRYDEIIQGDFKKIPGQPLAYWLSQVGLGAFNQPKLSEIGKTRRGLQTGEKSRFIRYWYECDLLKTELKYLPRDKAINSAAKWFMFNNGGDCRKWYGGIDLVVNWKNNGKEIKAFDGAIIPSEELYFLPAISWPRISTGQLGFRLHPEGVIPGDLSPCYYTDEIDISIGFLNSSCSAYFLEAINPTITSPVGDVAKIPFPSLSTSQKLEISKSVNRLVELHRNDWENNETSWDYHSSALVNFVGGNKLKENWNNYEKNILNGIAEAINLEMGVSEVFIDSCGLVNEIASVIHPGDITLARADREKDCQRLISYAIGCMMGRYSLDEPGLIYAHAGNVGFNPSRYTRFAADADGIVPLTDEHWFDDEAAVRVREFLQAVWGAATLQENMAWLAESLGAKSDESPDETIRRYLADKFYKDHLQTYKKRPIYWLFSSGKQGAFQALVYLHRYNEGTLSRMRMEYVVPLQSRMQALIDKLDADLQSSASSAQTKKLQKQKDSTLKKLEELRRYDEKLRHHADQRITLDLDDGVKVNYGRFGDLLADVKLVCGDKDD